MTPEKGPLRLLPWEGVGSPHSVHPASWKPQEESERLGAREPGLGGVSTLPWDTSRLALSRSLTSGRFGS